MSSDLTATYSRFPGRKAQIDELRELLFDDDLATVPPNIFVTGPNSTGKTAITKALAQELSVPRTAWINCTSSFTPRLVFEGIFTQVLRKSPSPRSRGGWVGVKRCETMFDFTSQLSEFYDTALKEDRVNDTGIVVFFDEAEQLRKMGQILKGLFRLREFTKLDIVCVFISHLSWTNFQASSETIPPHVIYFPSYSQDEVINILALDCPNDYDLDFYLNFVEMIYKVFIKPCNDLSELRHVVGLLFPKYIEPIILGKAKQTETRKLFSYIQYHIRDALKSLYLREISTSEWQRKSIEKKSLSALKTVEVDVNLSYYSKFLLIASFLASYNPPKFDVQFFVRSDTSITGKKRGRPKGSGKKQDNSAAMAVDNTTWRQKLLGPRPFQLERMLAIFYSILESDVDTTIDINHQIALLVKLKLIIRITSADNLESMKCKCNVSYDFITNIARTLRFDMARYLYEFN